MPISRDLFDRGLSDEQSRLLELLKGSPDQAFTQEEIWTKLGSPPPIDPLTHAIWLYVKLPMLQELLQRGLIEVKAMGGKTYYAFKPTPRRGNTP